MSSVFGGGPLAAMARRVPSASNPGEYSRAKTSTPDIPEDSQPGIPVLISCQLPGDPLTTFTKTLPLPLPVDVPT